MRPVFTRWSAEARKRESTRVTAPVRVVSTRTAGLRSKDMN
jgi:hypothetical protein